MNNSSASFDKNTKLILARSLWAGIAAALPLILLFQGQIKVETGIMFFCGFFASWIYIGKLAIKKIYLYWTLTVLTSLLIFSVIVPFFGFPFNQTPPPTNFSEWFAGFKFILIGSLIMLPYSLSGIVAFIVGDILIFKRKFLKKI